MKDKKVELVAIWMVTYNHQDYIAQAIESVMKQKTSFHYKLYIGEDCSTDNTRQICIQIQKKFPEKIELLLNEKNLGASENAHQVYKACQESGASFIALLEGDDYWTDDHKLEKQVEFLKTNSSYTACFHNVSRVNENNGSSSKVYANRKETIDIQDLLVGDYMKTNSLVFRNDKNLLLPMLNRSIPIDDTSLGYCLLSNGAKAKYLAETMAAYRIHNSGIWSSISYAKQNDWVLNDTKSRYQYYYNNDTISQGIKVMLLSYLKQQTKIELKRYRLLKAFQCLTEYVAYKFFNFH